MSHIKIIEQVAYQSEEPDVVEKSIGLFVNCHLAICEHEDQKRYAKEKQDLIDKKTRQEARTANPDDKAVIQKELAILKAQEDKEAVHQDKR